MSDWAQSGRINTFDFVLVDPFTLQEVGSIESRSDAGSLSWNVDASNWYSATLNLAEQPSRDYMIRVKQRIQLEDEYSEQVLATMFVDKAPVSYLNGKGLWKASCFSPMYRYTKDILYGNHFWPVGHKVVDAIKEIVVADGSLFKIDNTAGYNLDRTFSVPVMFPHGYKKYDAIQEMASWIGCKIYPDAYGYITLAPWIDPSLRPLTFDFTEGVNECVYQRGYNYEDLQADSYNRWLVWYETAEGSSVADAHLDGNHPFSFQRIGRWVTYTETVQDAIPQTDLQALADRRKAENSVYDRYIEIKYASNPYVNVGCRVRYENSNDGVKPIAVLGEMAQIDLKLDKTALATGKIRVIS